MAGDWMKIELELPDKPEVHSIAGILNIDPDAVVGKLIRIWQWFDKHTTDGNAHGVTFALPDRISGVTGFGEAMFFVGWLEQNDKVLTMPKFDRHTSSSAKTRALTNKRVEKTRTKEIEEIEKPCNAATVTVALPEKRREENKLKPSLDMTDGFIKFWEAWPSSKRKGGKSECYKKWKSQNLELKSDEIIAHVVYCKGNGVWKNPDYIEAPLVYINNAKWDGAEITPKDKPFDKEEWLKSI